MPTILAPLPAFLTEGSGTFAAFEERLRNVLVIASVFLLCLQSIIYALVVIAYNVVCTSE